MDNKKEVWAPVAGCVVLIAGPFLLAVAFAVFAVVAQALLHSVIVSFFAGLFGSSLGALAAGIAGLRLLRPGNAPRVEDGRVFDWPRTRIMSRRNSGDRYEQAPRSDRTARPTGERAR
jgi:hypothetical protein